MNTARQVIRWSIPGAVFILVLVLYEMPVAVLLGAPTHYVSDRISGIDLSPLLALAIFASIAFGYLIYQFYFTLYGMVSFPVVRLARADRGLEILWHLARGEDLEEKNPPKVEATDALQKQLGDLFGAVTDMERFTERREAWPHYLQLKELDKDGNTVTRRRAKDAQRVNWSATKSLLDLVTSQSVSSHVHQEYTTLSDIYHSLGASIVAAFLALVIFVGVNLGFYRHRWDDPLWRSAIAALLVMTIATILVAVFLSNRRNAFHDSQNTLKFGLRFHALQLGITSVDREMTIGLLLPASDNDVALAADGE